MCMCGAEVAGAAWSDFKVFRAMMRCPWSGRACGWERIQLGANVEHGCVRLCKCGGLCALGKSKEEWSGCGL